jgi:cytochrome bd-type quinol oxidase subunit 2
LLSKLLIIGIFLAILYTLASSFYFLVKDQGDGDRTVRRLSWRVGLSLGLVVLLWVAFQFGIIEPQGVNPVRYPAGPGG